MKRGSLSVQWSGCARVFARLTLVVAPLLVAAASLIGQGGSSGADDKSGAASSRGTYDSGDPGDGGFGRDVDVALLAMLKLTDTQQATVLTKVKAAVGKTDTPLLRSIREFAARARAKFKPRFKSMSRRSDWKERKGGGAEILEGLRFPVANQYVFGQGAITAVDAVVGQAEMERISARSAKHGKRRGRRKKRSRHSKPPKGLIEAPAFLQVRAMLRGNPPDLDLCVSAILRELDNDRSADKFSVFLEEWRNGPESFYRALDRTAGTKDSVFFYDAMLGKYLTRFVPRSHPDYKTIRRSTDAAHDSLHAAFLAYRQYRAIRECIALAMVLPPDAKLPGSLARYEKLAYQGYSVREMLTLLLHGEGQDIRAVLRIVIDTAPPLAEYLWTAKYDPFPPLYKAFDGRLSKMTASKHSDVLLREQHEGRAKMGRECAATARGAFLAAMAAAKK